MPAPGFDLDGYRKRWQTEIDASLEQMLAHLAADRGCPSALLAAMRYSLLSGGKRLRPLIVLAATRACGGQEQAALGAGCALEMIHAYSLIHDDLPAMDDDDFRRGQPTCHRAHGEAMAILAGDGLLTHAFELLSHSVPEAVAARALSLLARAAGPAGMVGGQADDVAENQQMPSLAEVEFNHQRKTAALFAAAVALGGLIGGAGRDQAAALDDYGQAFGLAYQITDDLLAYQGDAETLGRPTGSDEIQDRKTHPRVAGLARSRQRTLSLVEDAILALRPFSEKADALIALAKLLASRV